MADSVSSRLSTSFVDCWFEKINGFAVDAGTNTDQLSFTRTYFEFCGTPTVKPVVLNNARAKFDDCTIIGGQNNDDAFIEASGGSEITVEPHTLFQTIAGRVFVEYTSIINFQNLKGLSIRGQNTQTFKELLFTVPTPTDEKWINWDITRLTSTLTDTQIQTTNKGNQSFKGFVSHVTDEIQLPAQDTEVTIATVNTLNAGNGLRLSVESYQTIQGVGFAGQFNEIFARFDGADWVFSTLTDNTVIAGFTFSFTSIDATGFTIEVQRTVGAATNSPFKALVTIRQAAYNMDGNEVTVS
jgi:hypothetical protein